MLELNKEYNSGEFYKAAEIPRRAWETRKEDVLQHIRTFYNIISYRSGKCIIYKPIAILKEPYEPLPTKRNAEKMKAFYREQTHKIVDGDPWNTGSNVARRIVAENNKYEHAESTAAAHVRPIIKEDYYREDSQWMRCNYTLNRYESLTDTQVEYLKDCFSKAFSKEDKQMSAINAYADMKAGYISKEEAGEKALDSIGQIFDAAMARFYEKYGFRPLRVSKLVEGKPLDFTI